MGNMALVLGSIGSSAAQSSYTNNVSTSTASLMTGGGKVMT